MSSLPVRRHDLALLPDSARVVVRPFIPGDGRRVASIIGRALALSEEEVAGELAAVHRQFDTRHLSLDAMLAANFARVEPHMFTHRPLSPERQLLIGALFSGEYALEAAALFNPSIVPHPDQGGLPPGSLRFILSLRATGEGHISSIEFRVGTLTALGEIELEPVSRFVTAPELVRNPTYQKASFILKLHEMGLINGTADAVMASLGDEFSRSELATSLVRARRASRPVNLDTKRTLEGVQWLADSNYELLFPDKVALSERIIFPVSANESNGIEDARFVQFTEDDGTVKFYGTYTAYNGRAILPQLLETLDFLHFRIITLNGGAVQNKGMAMFPRRVNGHYAMLSRQDDENLFLMFSDHPHYWNDPQIILRPAHAWESVKIGNCGSPIETEAGWLVITHGVGPLRTYCIGAALLDLEDPTRVLGRLQEPLLTAEGLEREGYVPNVVYSCGALVHGGQLILPFAKSDKATGFASLPLDLLLEALRAN